MAKYNWRKKRNTCIRKLSKDLGEGSGIIPSFSTDYTLNSAFEASGSSRDGYTVTCNTTGYYNISTSAGDSTTWIRSGDTISLTGSWET